MFDTPITRRELFYIAGATFIAKPAFANKEDEQWERAQKDKAARQPVLDDLLKNSTELKNVVSRCYAVYLTDASTTRQKGALIFGGKELRCEDSRADKPLHDEVMKHSEAYANAHKDNPSKIKEDTDRAYNQMAAALISRVENKPSDFVDLAHHPGADSYLEYSLWGTGLKSIVLATRPFFESADFKTAEDRKSVLLDYVGSKASDQFNNPDSAEIWTGSLLSIRMGAIFSGSPGTKDTWMIALKNRWSGAQADKIVSKKRAVSESYLEAMSNAWESSAEFKCAVKMHQEYVSHVPKLTDPELRKTFSDTMGNLMKFKHLPSDGKLVPYTLEKVSQYKFDDKK
jgi:hypothetical protein